MDIRKTLLTAVAACTCLSGLSSAEVTVGGDLRLRTEFIDEDGKTPYWQERVRARVQVAADLDDDLDVIFRFVTGSGSPTSANQNLGDSFASKNLRIDRAALKWNMLAQSESDADLLVGKMPNPFHRIQKTGLIWDSDINPEGIALKYGGERLFGTLGAFIFDADGKHTEADQSPSLFAAQIGVKSSGLILGAGVYGYSRLAGSALLADATDGMGNTTVTVDPDGLPANGDEYEGYANDYVLAELFASYTAKLGAEESPLTFYADLVSNTSTGTDTGLALGVSCGKALQGKVALTVEYRMLQKDAVIGAFSDSDFMGAGTNRRGVVAKLDVGLRDRAVIRFTGILGPKDMDSDDMEHGRFQMDVKLKF